MLDIYKWAREEERCHCGNKRNNRSPPNKSVIGIRYSCGRNKSRKHEIFAASIYLDIGNEIIEDLSKLANLLQFAKGKVLIMAIDSNAGQKSGTI